MLTRRDCLKGALIGLPSYALLAEFVPVRDALASGLDARRWIGRQQEIALALARGEIRPIQWQAEVEALARTVDLPQLIAEVGRTETKVVGQGTPTDPVKRTVTFHDETGARRKLRYATALFTFGRNDVITPHAHRHMASAHLVLEGAFHVRTFDRVRDENGAIVIKPATDTIVTVGEVSTMSSERNNIHWFVPQSDRAVTFDVIVSDLDKGEPSFQIDAVDPVRGTRLADGSLRAPILSFQDASAFYTPDV
jgi:hypothetical protein